MASAASYSTDSGSSATHLCLLEVRLRRAPGTAWYNVNRPNLIENYAIIVCVLRL